MTNIETILKMLEDPESDKDEVNAWIWCFERDTDILLMSKDKKGCRYFNGVCDSTNYPPKYTTSLDAAMSIGAEELEGWTIKVTQTGRGFTVSLTLPYEYMTNIKDFGDMPRAISHARCQALGFVRGL